MFILYLSLWKAWDNPSETKYKRNTPTLFDFTFIKSTCVINKTSFRKRIQKQQSSWNENVEQETRSPVTRTRTYINEV